MVKHLPAMWKTWVRSLGQEDPLEKEMATHFSTLAWKIPWTEECCRLQSMRLQRVGHGWAISLHFTIIKKYSFWKKVHLFFVLFFFPFIFISWRLITLQYCSGFCHTLTWISHGSTCRKKKVHLCDHLLLRSSTSSQFLQAQILSMDWHLKPPLQTCHCWWL